MIFMSGYLSLLALILLSPFTNWSSLVGFLLIRKIASGRLKYLQTFMSFCGSFSIIKVWLDKILLNGDMCLILPVFFVMSGKLYYSCSFIGLLEKIPRWLLRIYLIFLYHVLSIPYMSFGDKRKRLLWTIWLLLLACGAYGCFAMNLFFNVESGEAWSASWFL